MIPYPTASSPSISAVMRGNRRRDTGPELRLRSALHAQGLRYRVDYPIRTLSVRVRPDIVFTKQRLAIFVDGCFFHACPTHGTRPRQNVQYWEQKLERNVLRDRRVTEALREERWTVIRLWEHQPTDEGLKIVMEVLQRS